MDGSVRNSSSKVFAGSGGAPPAFCTAVAQSVFAATVLLGSALLGMNPSCSHLRQDESKSVVLGVGEAAGAAGTPAVGAAASCGRLAGVPPAFCVGVAAEVEVDCWTRSLPLPVLTARPCVRQNSFTIS